MVQIYILLLETNKYYVGKTNNKEIQLDYLFNFDENEWTQK